MGLTVRPGTSWSAATTSGSAPSAFWWQWPCRYTSREPLLAKGSFSSPRRASETRNSSSSIACFAMGPTASDLITAPNSSRSVSRQEGSMPTMGIPRAAYGPSASTTRPNSTRASSTRPALRKVRPQQSGRFDPGPPPPFTPPPPPPPLPARLQHRPRGARVLGLEVAREGVHQQHHFLSAGLRRRRLVDVSPPGGQLAAPAHPPALLGDAG